MVLERRSRPRRARRLCSAPRASSSRSSRRGRPGGNWVAATVPFFAQPARSPAVVSAERGACRRVAARARGRGRARVAARRRLALLPLHARATSASSSDYPGGEPRRPARGLLELAAPDLPPDRIVRWLAGRGAPSSTPRRRWSSRRGSRSSGRTLRESRAARAGPRRGGASHPRPERRRARAAPLLVFLLGGWALVLLVDAWLVAWALVWRRTSGSSLLTRCSAALRFRSLRVGLLAVRRLVLHPAYSAASCAGWVRRMTSLSVVLPVFDERGQIGSDGRARSPTQLAEARRRRHGRRRRRLDGRERRTAAGAAADGCRAGAVAAEPRPLPRAAAGLEAATGARALARQPGCGCTRTPSRSSAGAWPPASASGTAHVDVGREREPVRRLRQRPRRARLARLLPRAAHDELRPRGLRPLPEGDDLLPRAARAAARGVRDVLDAVRRPAARERRHARAPRPRRARADPPLARVRLHLHAPRLAAVFLRHSLHRGVVFLDGHGRRESRFFPAVVAFYPVSAALAVAALRRPAAVPAGALGVALAAGAVAAAAGGRGSRRSRSARSRPCTPSPTGRGCGRARCSRCPASGRDPRRLRDDRGADQARAGAPPAARRAGTATCSRRPGSRCSRSRPSSTGSACGSPTSGSGAAPAGATCARTADIPGWLGARARDFRRHGAFLAARALRDGPGQPLVLVHGDTMTTVLGAAMGRALRVPSRTSRAACGASTCATRSRRSSTAALASQPRVDPLRAGRWAAGNLTARRRRRHRLEHDPRQPRARARTRRCRSAPATSRSASSAPPLRAAQRP